MSAPKVGETTTDQSLLGRKDAFHVPGILVKSTYSIGPGTRVRFTDETLTEVVPLYKEDFYVNFENEDGEEDETEISLPAQAVSDPFAYGGGKDREGNFKLFWVFPMPGTVNNLVHTYEVEFKDLKKLTEKELELIQEAADEESAYESCKGCYS